MIDKDLERRLQDCHELLELWHNYHRYFGLAVKGGDNINHDRETEFLHLKSRIAMLHDSFMESLKHDHAIGQHILSLVERSITLKHLNRLSVAEIKKMEIEWHESYLLLSETIATMEERMEEIDKINPTTYKMNKMKQNFIQGLQGFFGSVYFKLGAIVVVIPLALVIIHFFVWPFSNLKQIDATRKPYIWLENNVFRMINPGIPYSRPEHFFQRYSSLPEGISETDSTFMKSNIRQIIQAYEIASVLDSAETIFEDKGYKVEDNTVYALAYVFTGDTPVSRATDVYDQFQNWRNSITSSQRQSFEYQTSILRINNVILVLRSGSQSAREDVMINVFGEDPLDFQ